MRGHRGHLVEVRVEPVGRGGVIRAAGIHDHGIVDVGRLPGRIRPREGAVITQEVFSLALEVGAAESAVRADHNTRLGIDDIQAIGIGGLQLPVRNHRLQITVDLGVGQHGALVEVHVGDDTRRGRSAADVVTGLCQRIHVRALDNRRGAAGRGRLRLSLDAAARAPAVWIARVQALLVLLGAGCRGSGRSS